MLRLALLAAVSLSVSAAQAAAAPVVGATWASQVAAGSARLSAEIDPNGASTSYRFEYTTEAAYQADLAIAGHDGFTGASRLPTTGNFNLGLSALTVSKAITGLGSGTTYRYRVIATSSAGTATGSAPPHILITPAAAGGGGGCANDAVRAQQFVGYLADCRAYEMVSPVQKNGGQVELPGAIAGGGVSQAAAGGGAATYGSTASFAGGAGAFGASQYVARRTEGGWSTENVTPEISFHPTHDGVPYQLFSPDLARALLFNGEHCMGASCATANPPLAGTDAPEGFQDYYLRDNTTGAYTALVGADAAAELDLGPEDFDLLFAGASADLTHVAIESCAALAPGATEVAQGSGCDPAKPNLYEWSAGQGLHLITGATPSATLAASTSAISGDGARVYWSDGSGALHLDDGGAGKLVADGASFEVASADGATAYYTKAAHLYRYEATGAGKSTDLTPSGGVIGVLGAAADGSAVYYQDGAGLWLFREGAATEIAPNQAAPTVPAAESTNFPPATGTARVSADGSKLLFASAAALTGYDNTDLNTGEADAQLYLYDATAKNLTCVSCNPTNERPIGASTVPGAIANGTVPGSTQAYKPRVLAASARRVFFDSLDALAPADTNSDHLTGAGIVDAYEWRAPGEGGCSLADGCVSLLSSGRSPEGAHFIDASADGTDAFFITGESLLAADPGSQDLYDARANGGFFVPSPPIPCEGDACQVIPPEPVDPTLTTTLAGHGNPPVHYYRLNHLKKDKGKPKKHHKHGKQKHGRGGKG